MVCCLLCGTRLRTIRVLLGGGTQHVMENLDARVFINTGIAHKVQIDALRLFYIKHTNANTFVYIYTCFCVVGVCIPLSSRVHTLPFQRLCRFHHPHKHIHNFCPRRLGQLSRFARLPDVDALLDLGHESHTTHKRTQKMMTMTMRASRVRRSIRELRCVCSDQRDQSSAAGKPNRAVNSNSSDADPQQNRVIVEIARTVEARVRNVTKSLWMGCERPFTVHKMTDGLLF